MLSSAIVLSPVRKTFAANRWAIIELKQYDYDHVYSRLFIIDTHLKSQQQVNIRSKYRIHYLVHVILRSHRLLLNENTHCVKFSRVMLERNCKARRGLWIVENDVTNSMVATAQPTAGASINQPWDENNDCVHMIGSISQ